MIKLDITSRNFEADDKLKDYISDKIAPLDKFLPRQQRSAALAQVLIEEDPSGRENNQCVCEVILTAPGVKFVAREGTLNMYAAVDIVEAKLKTQIRSYKEKTIDRARRPRMLSRWFNRRREPEADTPESTV